MYLVVLIDLSCDTPLTIFLKTKTFYTFGHTLLFFLLVVIMVSVMTITDCIEQLSLKNYHWWWRSFLLSGSSGIWFLIFHLGRLWIDIGNSASIFLHLGYLFIKALLVFLLTGTIGVFACFCFIRKLFTFIKTHPVKSENSWIRKSYYGTLDKFMKPPFFLTAYIIKKRNFIEIVRTFIKTFGNDYPERFLVRRSLWNPCDLPIKHMQGIVGICYRPDIVHNEVVIYRRRSHLKNEINLKRSTHKKTTFKASPRVLYFILGRTVANTLNYPNDIYSLV